MKFVELFSRTTREAGRGEVSRNAQMLIRAGYINRLMAGVYTFLPLGLRVLNRIELIVRQEMDAIGGQEVLMPALQPREIWQRTGRWETVDVLYKLGDASDPDLALGPTHEEVVTPLVTSFIHSYRDLPVAAYQIQTKFRNEPRPKSGLLRGREFRMKDMYSFHADTADQDLFYERVIGAYRRIYERCGLGQLTLLTYASGGIFSKYSHEFQTVTPYGEDTIYRLPGGNVAVNKEIIGDGEALKDLIPSYKAGDEAQLEELRSIEVGNIFKLSSRFTDAFGAAYTDTKGARQKIIMGCYGLGPSRVMGTIAECLGDDRGLVWPAEVAPYQVHLISLAQTVGDAEQSRRIYDAIRTRGIEVLYDDRDISAGQKLADADLIGLPHRVVVSKKTLMADGVEWKPRTSSEGTVISIEKLLEEVESQARSRVPLPELPKLGQV